MPSAHPEVTSTPLGHSTALLAAMADGIGDLCFASEEWVAAAREALAAVVERHADALANQDPFTFCEVAHNPPVWLRCGGRLAWHARIDGARVTVESGELPAAECDLRIEGEHSVMSNGGRIEYHGNNPTVVAAAQARVARLSRWNMAGEMPEHPALRAALRGLHDAMAPRTMPRFTFMTPEWVSSARHVLTARAASAKYADGLRNVVFTFSEEFTHTPKYAFPDGAHGGFWVRCDHGDITVGAGPLPAELGPADALTKGKYTPVVPVGRTVNALMTDPEKEAQAAYSKAAFRREEETGKHPVSQSSPSGKGAMPPELARVFMPLHDELSKRTSGELPADFDDSTKPAWAEAQSFDRDPAYDPSWLRYDEFDIYGQPRKAAG